MVFRKVFKGFIATALLLAPASAIVSAQTAPVTNVAAPTPHYVHYDPKRVVAAMRKQSGPMIIVAHRGYWTGAWNTCPENSMCAIKQAGIYGIEMVELDVKTTSDGYLVPFHDYSVGRVTDYVDAAHDYKPYDPKTGKGSNRLISDMTMSDLRRWHLKNTRGDWGPEKATSLREMLDEATDNYVNIAFMLDTKSVEAAEKAAYLALDLHIEDIVVIKFPFNPSVKNWGSADFKAKYIPGAKSPDGRSFQNFVPVINSTFLRNNTSGSSFNYQSDWLAQQLTYMKNQYNWVYIELTAKQGNDNEVNGPFGQIFRDLKAVTPIGGFHAVPDAPFYGGPENYFVRDWKDQQGPFYRLESLLATDLGNPWPVEFADDRTQERFMVKWFNSLVSDAPLHLQQTAAEMGRRNDLRSICYLDRC